MPRYVVLHHRPSPGKPHARGDSAHFDWMFESTETLLTWATEGYNHEDSVIPAIQLPNHRTAYLVYEGPIAGDRGEVLRVESGHYERMWTNGEGNGDVCDDRYTFRVYGKQRNGIIVFQRMVDELNGGESGDRWSWSFRGLRVDAS